ncbi:hypothetical protein MKZ38_002902 [Zalerion maritima]|uniref:Mitochondrial glycine transporter n=1 Tax=Zalerion maritima TaxID=339359 RepID=A0AAD5RV00_9PEZI|nr:hypothetical protein MKZ38_002902 [Zalerion maritima]
MAPASTFHFAAGLGSGIFSAVLLQPVDLLKTRVQQSGHHSLKQTLRELRQNPNGMVVSLWRGTVPSAMRTGFGSALYFTSLNLIRQAASRAGSSSSSLSTSAASKHSSSLPQLSNSANMASGMVARSFAGFVLMPLTVIKVRYESSLYSYCSVLSAGRDIVRTEGRRGLFSGVGATTIRDAPNAGLYVLFYEQFKSRLSHLRHRRRTGEDGNKMSAGPEPFYYSSATINFVSGMLAGTTCSVISNPFDAVKTRIQLQPKDYHNMWQSTGKLLREEGPRALWDGLTLRMSRKALSSALAWTLYEELVKKASKAWQRGKETSSRGVP